MRTLASRLRPHLCKSWECQEDGANLRLWQATRGVPVGIPEPAFQCPVPSGQGSLTGMEEQDSRPTLAPPCCLWPQCAQLHSGAQWPRPGPPGPQVDSGLPDCPKPWAPSPPPTRWPGLGLVAVSGGASSAGSLGPDTGRQNRGLPLAGWREQTRGRRAHRDPRQVAAGELLRPVASLQPGRWDPGPGAG